MIVSAGTVVPGDAVWRPGWVETHGSRVVDAGAGTSPRPVDVDLPGAVVVPGFVDVHCHGGGGASFPSLDPDQALTAARFHFSRGTTSVVAGLVTDELPRLERGLRALGELVGDGVLAGLFLEGPWLSPRRRGAHDPTKLRLPEPADVRRLLTAGGDALRMVTIAPELDGGTAAIAEVAAAGVVAAVGHTDADLEGTRRAIDAGATMATHLFNAMPPVGHREPGPVAALIEDPRVTLELIADGVHLHPSIPRLLLRTVGAERIALVTDATAAAGQPGGTYRLGPLDVVVSDRTARLATDDPDDGPGPLAGGVATTADLFRGAMDADDPGHESPGALVRAVGMTSVTPARALGLTDVGRLSPGRYADLVVLDPDGWTVTGVLRRGRWMVEPPPALPRLGA